MIGSECKRQSGFHNDQAATEIQDQRQPVAPTHEPKRQDFHFDLPPELIAQQPPLRRGDSRLLTLDGPTGEFHDRWFAELPDLLRAGDLLVFNDTRVIRARLYGLKDTGGKVEVMIERII